LYNVYSNIWNIRSLKFKISFIDKVGDLSYIVSLSDDYADMARRSVVAIEIAKVSFL